MQERPGTPAYNIPQLVGDHDQTRTNQSDYSGFAKISQCCVDEVHTCYAPISHGAEVATDKK